MLLSTGLYFTHATVVCVFIFVEIAPTNTGRNKPPRCPQTWPEYIDTSVETWTDVAQMLSHGRSHTLNILVKEM